MEKKFGVVSADGHCRVMHLRSICGRSACAAVPGRRAAGRAGPTGHEWIVEAVPGAASLGRRRPGPGQLLHAGGLAKSPSPHLRAANANIAARTWTATGSTPSWSTAPRADFGIKDPELRAACVRASTDWRASLRGVERPVHHAAAAAVPDPEEAVAELLRSRNSVCRPG